MKDDYTKENNRIFTFPSKLLAILAHPDDEVMGCGGTLAKNSDLGGVSHVICLGGDPQRNKELSDSCQILGVSYQTLNLLEGAYHENTKDVVVYLKNQIMKNKPEFVITHREKDDYHFDHRIVSNMAKNAATSAQTPKEGWKAKGLLYTETHSLHQTFHVAVDITDYYDTLIKAFKCHESQITKNKGYYIDFLEKRCALRGVQTGCKYAEAFQYEPFPIIGSFNRHKFAE